MKISGQSKLETTTKKTEQKWRWWQWQNLFIGTVSYIFAIISLNRSAYIRKCWHLYEFMKEMKRKQNDRCCTNMIKWTKREKKKCNDDNNNKNKTHNLHLLWCTLVIITAAWKTIPKRKMTPYLYIYSFIIIFFSRRFLHNNILCAYLMYNSLWIVHEMEISENGQKWRKSR